MAFPLTGATPPGGQEQGRAEGGWPVDVGDMYMMMYGRGVREVRLNAYGLAEIYVWLCHECPEILESWGCTNADEIGSIVGNRWFGIRIQSV